MMKKIIDVCVCVPLLIFTNHGDAWSVCILKYTQNAWYVLSTLRYSSDALIVVLIKRICD